MKQLLVQNKTIAGILIFIFAFLIFTPSLNNDFIWDDVIDIKRQYFLYQEYDFTAHFFRDWTAEQKNSYYRPLHHLSYVMDYKLWGENPLGFHLTNVFLFSLSATAVFFLILLILGDLHIGSREYIALFGTIYFVLHPMHVESVSWIAGRTDLLCGLFFISAFLFHIKSFNNGKYVLASAPLFYLSLLSKEVGATFPFVAVVYHLLGSRRKDKYRLSVLLLYFCILVLYLYMRGGVFLRPPELSAGAAGSAEAADSSMLSDIISSVRVMLGAYIYYFIKMVFPFSFNAFITKVPQSLYVVTGAVISFVVLFYLWVRSAVRGNGVLAVSVTWIVLTLGPSVLVAVFSIATTPLAERYLFVPTAGLALAAGYLFVKLIKVSPGTKTAVYVIIGVFLFSHFYATIDRQSVWDDRLSFWDSAVADATDSAVPLINYGMALIDEGRTDLGMQKLEKALGSDLNAGPELKSIAANNLGIAYLDKRDLRSAEKWFREGVSHYPAFYKSYYHLGLVHYTRAQFGNTGRELSLAERLFKKAIEIHPNYARAYFFLARVNIAYGNVQQAKVFAQTALDIGLERPMDAEARRIINFR